jgi:hypothetical protein
MYSCCFRLLLPQNQTLGPSGGPINPNDSWAFRDLFLMFLWQGFKVGAQP